jgi:hypothetical protein
MVHKHSISIKHLFFTITLLALFNSKSLAQMKRPQIELAGVGNLMLEVKEFTRGYGGSVKLLLPQKKNYVTIAANFDVLPTQGAYNIHYNLVTMSSGYRKVMNVFYIEPQFGLGYSNLVQNHSLGNAIAFTFGPELGLQIKNLVVALNYRGVLTWAFWMDLVHVFSIKVGIKLNGKGY